MAPGRGVEGPKRPKRRGSFGERVGMGQFRPPNKEEVEEFEATLDQLEEFFKQEKVENLRMRRASGERLQDFAQGLERLKIDVEPELTEATRQSLAPAVKATPGPTRPAPIPAVSRGAVVGPARASLAHQNRIKTAY